MMRRTETLVPGGRLRPARWVALLAATMLAACAGDGGLFGGSGGGSAAPRQVVAPSDPVVAWAATAAPGTETRLTVDGQPTTVAVRRAYISANGRECRELSVGMGTVLRNRLVCNAETGWVEARPLLRGGGTARP
jgi:hypothetical protein